MDRKGGNETQADEVLDDKSLESSSTSSSADLKESVVANELGPKRAPRKQCEMLRRWNWYRKGIRESEHSKQWDEEQNQNSKLSELDAIHMPAIWVAELYTPSTVEGLVNGVRDLGWNESYRMRKDLGGWMNDVRAGRSAGWISLGLVARRDSKNFLKDRVADLPHGVRAALPILLSITPSITAFVIVFIFEDDVAGSLQTVLRSDFVSETRRDSRLRFWHVINFILTGKSSEYMGYTTQRPDDLRRNLASQKVDALEEMCIRWVSDKVPGVFSLKSGNFPTAVLYVTEQEQPMSSEEVYIPAWEAFGLNKPFEVWESLEWPWAKMRLPSYQEKGKKRLVFTCRRRDALTEGSKMYHEPTSNWTLSHRADKECRGLLARWSVTCLLDSYYEDIAELRDQSARDGEYRAIRDLKRLRSLARTKLFDIGVCTQEIEDFTSSKISYNYSATAMKLNGSADVDFLDNLRRSQAARAKQVRRDADLLRETLALSSNLSQTIANIRIQWFVVALAVISIVVALWAALK